MVQAGKVWPLVCSLSVGVIGSGEDCGQVRANVPFKEGSCHSASVDRGHMRIWAQGFQSSIS